MSEQNTISNDQQTKIWEILREVAEKSTGGDYIYRGEPECYEKVSSGLYRQYKDIDVEHFKVEDVQKEILAKAKQFTDKTDELEILAELQHYGGQTNLIDFTTDYHTALFFACDGSHDKCGRLILQKRQNLVVYQPREPRNRVIAQKSIFVRPDAGFIEPDPDEMIIIPAELKQPLLNHLHNYHGISSETIYNDLHGFIKIQAIHESAYTAFYRGLTYQDTGKYDKAIEQYDKSIELNPNLANAYFNRGNAKDSLGHHEKAINDYNEAIRLNPDYADAYTHRGNANISLGRHEDAIADYDQAIRLNPDHAEAYNNRGNAKNRLGQHQDAIADCDEAIRLKPNNAQPYFNRGIVNYRLGQHQDAIADCDQAIKLKPDYAAAYLNRGLSYLETNQQEEARRDLETARDLAQQAGKEDIAAAADQELRNLDAPDEDE